MSNFGLYKALDKAGIRYEKTAVGDRYVYENMKENDFMIGGEQSGHIIFRKYAHTGDGLITALMLMQVMIDTQLPLSVLAAGVTMYPQVLKNVRVDDKDRHAGGRRRAGRRGRVHRRAGRFRPGAAAEERHGAGAPGHGGGRYRRGM